MSRLSLVTGATGQIGLPLARALLAGGQRVRALVRDEGRGATAAQAGAELARGDIDDPASLAAAMRGVDEVWHLAGGLRGAGAFDADRLNRVGTENVVSAARAAGSVQNFVFASSCAVYGDRRGLWGAEDYPPAPHTNGGTAKGAAEAAVLAAAAGGLPAKVARIAAVYGPALRFTMADEIKRGRGWLPGEGRNLVPVIHVDDCVSALIAVGAGGQDGAVYNVSGPSTPTLKEFYAAVHARVGGSPVRFWSTWIPSALQFAAARRNEGLAARLGRKPRFTPDNLRLMTASVRLKVERMEKELGFTWAHPDYRDGLAASFPA